MLLYLQEVAGQIEGGPLHVGLDVVVLAHHLGQSRLPELSQLGLREPYNGVYVFIPAMQTIFF